MRVYLNVPYSEKEIAKRRSCRWDNVKKLWYIEDPLHIELYVRWIPEYILKNTLIDKASTASNVSKSRGEHGKV
jgi:hypothetical protein